MPSPERDDIWVVYVLAATTVHDLMLVGGHSWVEVDQATGEVLNVKALSNTCLTLDVSETDGPDGNRGVVVPTHVVKPMSLEIYPFLSLLHRRPIALMSDRGRWLVAGSQITFS